jgi:hypothetical protein
MRGPVDPNGSGRFANCVVFQSCSASAPAMVVFDDPGGP